MSKQTTKLTDKIGKANWLRSKQKNNSMTLVWLSTITNFLKAHLFSVTILHAQTRRSNAQVNKLRLLEVVQLLGEVTFCIF